MEKVSKLNEAFHNFTEASKSLETYYLQLNRRVQYLTNELEKKNSQLNEAILEVGESKDYLQTILQSIGEAIIVTDQNEQITMLNKAAEDLLCIVQKEAAGTRIDGLDIVIANDSSGMKLTVGKRDYDIIMSRSEVTDSDGALRGYVVLIKDISVIKDLERQNERNQRLISMGEMAAKIVHEIRSPLCSIELFSNMLSSDLKGSAHSEMAEGISTGIKSLNNILTNMLFFAKPQKSSLRIISVDTVVESTIGMLKALIDARGIKLEKNVEANQIHGDAELLKQVFMNVIMNGIQSMQDGGTLRVDVSTRDAYTVVSVIDHGEGIDSENIEKIFDPFFSTKEKGTGLGLAIAHKIMLSHRGFIKARKNDGPGSTFSVYFPVIEDEPHIIDEDSRGLINNKTKRKERVCHEINSCC